MAQIIDAYSGDVAGQWSALAQLSGVHQQLVGQSFRTGNQGWKLTSANLWLSRYGSPSGTMYVRVYPHNGMYGGSSSSAVTPIATSDPISVTSVVAQPAIASFTATFSGANAVSLEPNTPYVLTAEYALGSGSDFIGVLIDQISPTHSGNFSRISGGIRYTSSSEDMCFIVSGEKLPTAGFLQSASSGIPPLSVTFTDISTESPTSWLWDFGDGTTSTLQNPTHDYTSPDTYTVTLAATNAFGSGSVSAVDLIHAQRPITQTSALALSPTIYVPTVLALDPPPPPPTDWSALGKEDEKVYVYKVYTAADVYVGTWNDVIDDLEFTQRLNTPGTTTTVQLGRSANTRKEVRDVRITQDGLDTRITQDDAERTTVTTTSNTVGEDTDVELNYRVEVYVHYGEFAERITEDGSTRITEDGDVRVAAVGAPLGTRIFSGFIMDYESVYGTAGVTVTLASNGFELANEVIRTGASTTVTYSSTALETIAKSILDTNPGRMGYTAASMDATGVTESLTYRLNTKLEGIETVYDQTPDGWYWYGDVAENTVYLKPASTGYDHTFIIGLHIKELRVKRSIEDLKNAVWFVGGESGGTTVYKYYEDAPSQSAWRKGIERITDRRYTVAASMQRRADKLMGRYKDPIFTSPLTISSARYDIESIRLGQTVGFRNFDNFIDELPPLQIVSLSYTPTAVTVELGELQMRQIDDVAAAERALAEEQYVTIPNAPS